MIRPASSKAIEIQELSDSCAERTSSTVKPAGTVIDVGGVADRGAARAGEARSARHATRRNRLVMVVVLWKSEKKRRRVVGRPAASRGDTCRKQVRP